MGLDASQVEDPEITNVKIQIFTEKNLDIANYAKPKIYFVKFWANSK